MSRVRVVEGNHTAAVSAPAIPTPPSFVLESRAKAKHKA